MARQNLAAAALDINLINASIHAGGVNLRCIGRQIHPEYGAGKLEGFGLFCLHDKHLTFCKIMNGGNITLTARHVRRHARISLIAGALSSTRWKVGILGRSYSAYGSIPSALKIVANRFFSLNG